ncbi:HutD/Ves family protein [Paraburkholderia terrae]
MSAIDIRAIASIPFEPWRNGAGVTRTFAAQDDAWRVSMAEIERDGPYSRFEDVSRTSLVLRGGGVALRHDASVVLLKPFEAAEYDGDKAWMASLVSGPVTALNVMSASGRYRTRVRVLVDTMIVQPDCAVVVVATGSGCSFSEPGTMSCGDVVPGHVLVARHLSRPLRLAPCEHAIDSQGLNGLPVLVTIEPATIRTND